MKKVLTFAVALLLPCPSLYAGELKFSGYMQAQYVEDERSRNELDGAGSRNLDQFTIRRGRVKLTYQVTPAVRVVVQPDLSSSGVSLKDLYAEITEPWTGWKNTLTVGQFGLPFGFELRHSSGVREMPERPRIIRTLFADRDRGVILSGAGAGGKLHYQLAVVNGTPVGRDDVNQEKDVVARLSYSFRAVGVGASMYRGTDLVATSSNRAGAGFAKNRHGLNVQWTTPIPGLALRGEYIAGRQPPPPNSDRTASHEVDGWHVYALQNLGRRHQVVLRLDEYDADTRVGQNAIRTIGGGYNLLWDRHNKVMFAYEVPRSEGGDDPDDNVLTVRYQLSF